MPKVSLVKMHVVVDMISMFMHMVVLVHISVEKNLRSLSLSRESLADHD